MKKITIILLSILSVFCFLFVGCGGDETPSIESADGFKYSISSDKSYYQILIYEGDETDVIIPETFNNLPVKEIAMEAFAGCSEIQTVVVPKSIETIGSRAFRNCIKLQSIQLPSGVTEIGEYSFEKCSSLTSIKIPSSLKIIGKFAFSECRQLKSVTFEKGSQLKVLSYATFWTCSSLETVVFEENSQLTDIGPSAFYNCQKLSAVTFPTDSKLVGISEQAFYNCLGLQNIKFPSGINTIGASAFGCCKSLQSIEITSSVAFIGASAFKDCDKLTEIHVSNLDYWCEIGFGNEFANPMRIGAILYCNGEPVTTINLSSDVKEIKAYAFYDCDNLLTVNLSNATQLKTIGDKAFYDCDNLQSVTFAKNGQLARIGAYAFRYCFKVKSIELPSSVITIDEFAFLMCGLTSLEIPNGVKYINRYAFSSCSDLRNVVIPSSILAIGEGAFEECYMLSEVYNLSTLTVTKGATSNGKLGFYALGIYNTKNQPSKITTDANGFSIFSDGEISSLVRYTGTETVVNVPDNVTAINAMAFKNCDTVEMIEIPYNVLNVGDYAFHSCKNLQTVRAYDNPQDTESVLHIGEYAFGWCENLQNVLIPDRITSVAEHAFYECNNLQYNEYDNAYYLGNSANPYLILIKGKDKKIESCIINPTTKIIYSHAFGDSLTSIVIPESVTKISKYAFSSCWQLKSLTFEDIHVWYVTTSVRDWENRVDGDIVPASDSAKNAEYFREPYYYKHYWYKKH